MRRPRYVPDYSPPARDSDRARANAQMLLCGATDAAFERLTAEGLAQSHRLSVKVAEYMIGAERGRRQRSAANG